MINWVVWQLVDSAFPSGGFAHSGGLEAAWQHGAVGGGASLVEFIAANLTSVGRSQLAFVAAAHRQPEELSRLDRLCDAFLNNHVANRASRRQGQALLASAESAFRSQALTELRALAGGRAGHFAPAFGAVTRSVGIGLEESLRLFLFVTLRGLISSAVRLGVVGPLEGQAIQHRLSSIAEGIAQRCGTTPLEDVAQTAPVIDVLSATHDRLYSRLFQS